MKKISLNSPRLLCSIHVLRTSSYTRRHRGGWAPY